MPRVIYSLHLDCEREPGQPITAFVVNLNRAGNSEIGGIVPIGKPRIVDLRVGDWFRAPTDREEVQAGRHLSAYRQHQLTEEQVAAGDIPRDGYVAIKCSGCGRQNWSPAGPLLRAAFQTKCLESKACVHYDLLSGSDCLHPM